MKNETTSFFGADENVIEFLKGDTGMTVTLSDRHLINTVERLAKKFPEIKILAHPKDNGGYLYAHLPLEFLRLQAPPKLPTVSDEQRARGRRLIEEARKAQEVVRTDVVFEPKTASNPSEV